MRNYKDTTILVLIATCAIAIACAKPEPAAEEAKSPLLVEDGAEIDLTYEAKLADGRVIDRNPETGPITFTVGAGKLQPRVEEALKGLRRGEEKTFEIADAYGTYDASKTGTLPPGALPDGAKVGDSVNMTGGVPPSVIKEIRDDGVVLDLNHPLAGKVVTFVVKIEDVRKPKEG